MNDNDVIIDADFAYKVIKHITSRSHIAIYGMAHSRIK